jgi:hypothetical protein
MSLLMRLCGAGRSRRPSTHCPSCCRWVVVCVEYDCVCVCGRGTNTAIATQAVGKEAWWGLRYQLVSHSWVKSQCASMRQHYGFASDTVSSNVVARVGPRQFLQHTLTQPAPPPHTHTLPPACPPLQVFPQLHILHQTRDGRDVACSNINSTSRRMTQPYQRHYVKLISGGATGAVVSVPVHKCQQGHHGMTFAVTGHDMTAGPPNTTPSFLPLSSTPNTAHRPRLQCQ